MRLSRLFSDIATQCESARDTARRAQTFLHAFLRWTQCQVVSGGDVIADSVFCVGMLPSTMSLNDQSVCFLVIPADAISHLNSPGLSRLINTVLTRGKRHCDGGNTPVLVIVLACVPQTDELQKLFKSVPSTIRRIALFEEEIRATVVSENPMKTFRAPADSTLGRKCRTQPIPVSRLRSVRPYNCASTGGRHGIS